MAICQNHRSTANLTTVQLRKLCDQAVALRFSTGPNARFWEAVNPDGTHVVAFWIVHRPNLAVWKGVDHPWNFAHGGGKNIRATVQCQMRGTMKPCEILCDFDHDAFLALVGINRNRTGPRRTTVSAQSKD